MCLAGWGRGASGCVYVFICLCDGQRICRLGMTGEKNIGSSENSEAHGKIKP